MKHSGMLPSHCRCCSCFEQPEKRKTPCASPIRYTGGVFIPLPFPLFHRSSAETGFLTCRKALIARRKNEQTVRQIERNANKDTRPSAKLSYARVSVQKACFVLDAIRGKDVQTALGILTYNPRYASSLIKKLLESAIANAENNNGMNVENLYIEECYANKGPTMKRIKPRAQGRAYRIEKRMSHITLVLNER